MGMRGIAAGLVVGLSFLVISPFCWAADGDAAEAAPLTETSATSLDVDHVRAEIEATRATNPELAEVMEEQLGLVESGQLSYEAITQEAGRSTEGSATGSSLSGERLAGTGGEMMGTPLTGGFRGSSGETTRQGDPAYMTPELRTALEDVYDQVQGGTLSESDARARADSILSEHGVTEAMTSPREAFEQWERSAEGQNTSHEMVEQYREQAEQYQREFEQHGGTSDEQPEGQSREYETSHESYEASHESDTPTRESESMTHEAPTYDAPTHDDAPAAPTHDEAPTTPESQATEQYSPGGEQPMY